MGLADLPTELIDNLASYLDLCTYRSFRLLCVSLNEQTLHSFRDRYFRTRTLYWTKEDLQRVVDISQHQNFGSALRHLIIDATPRHSIALWHLRKLISETTAISPSPNAVLFKSDLQAQHCRDEQVAKQLDTYFTETRFDQKCLVVAFSKIPELESIVFEYESMKKEFSKFRRQYCETSQHEMSRPFVSTLSALSSSPHLKVREISVNAMKQYGAVSIGRLESIAPLLRNLDGCFEKLEVLKLHLRDWREGDPGFVLATERPPFIVRFLAKAINLKHLSLSCRSYFEYDIFGKMSRHCAFPKLETCWLALFRVFTEDLLTFLQPSYETLKSLDLHCIRQASDVTTWTMFLQSTMESNEHFSALRKLCAEELITHDGSSLHFGPVGNDAFVAGSLSRPPGEWRKQGLEILERMREKEATVLWHTQPFSYPFESGGPQFP